MADNSPRIFISYRRSETRAHAGWLGYCLEEEFGRSNVFRDVEKIGVGDWQKAIEKNVRLSDIVLCLMGDQWLSVTDRKAGGRRLDDPEDILRWEIALSLRLKTSHSRVIPILLDEAQMSDGDELPPDLMDLPRQNAHRLTYETWRGALQGLIEKIRSLPLRRPDSLSGSELVERWAEGNDAPNYVGVNGGFPPKGTGRRLESLRDGGGWRSQHFHVQFGGDCPNHQNWGEVDHFLAAVGGLPVL